MSKQIVSEAEIIQMTLENVRSFYDRKKGDTTAPMTDNFMWIGSNDFQWCEGLDEFYRVTEKEYEEPPVLLSDEEYHLLLHERNIWVVYGRYKATAVLEDGSVIYAHVRGTYVWQRINGKLKLAHVHGSHAQDIPLNQLAPSQKLTEHSSFFDYMKRMDTRNMDADKIEFRDRAGKHHFLFADEILYLKAAGQYTTVFTKADAILASGLLAEHLDHLPAQFKRIQKSYAVNTQYVDTIFRYKAVLKDGQTIPIGKDWYMDLKRFLQKGTPKMEKQKNSRP